MADPIVYGPGFSTYTRSVLLALEEKGVGYDLREVNIFAGEAQNPEHLARQPFGKVPAFEHDGFALYETPAILRYVDEAFDGPALQPADARGRARMTQIISIVDSYTYPQVITQIVVQRVVMPLLGETTDESAIAGAMEPAGRALRALDSLIGDTPFAAGDRPSLADLHLAPIIDYLRQTPEGERLMGEVGSLSRWWAKMQDRPSVTRTTPQLG